MERKRGQMKLSFGMIFSIILIIVFVAFAFYVINILVGLQSSSSSVKLVNNLQGDINKVWKSAESLQDFEYFISSDWDNVCFVDFSSGERGPSQGIYADLRRDSFAEGNFVLYSKKGSNLDFNSFEIENLNLEETIRTENPLCFDSSSGKIKITLKKGFSESLVTVMK